MKSFEKQALKQAQKLDDTSSEDDIKKIDSNIGKMKKGSVAKIWDKVIFLWEKLKSPEIPASLKITIAGALLYLILPADVIPDEIPGIGLIDDAGVILLVFNEVSKFVFPKVVNTAKKIIQESYYKKIDIKLNEIFHAMLLNSIFTFLINISGFLIILLKPAGDNSKFIAPGIFTVASFILYSDL